MPLGAGRREESEAASWRPVQSALTGGLFFALMRCATIFVSLLRIPGLFTGHISGIEMVLAFGILAGLLLIWVFVVRRWTSHSLERVTMLNGTQVVMFQHPVSLACLATS